MMRYQYLGGCAVIIEIIVDYQKGMLYPLIMNCFSYMGGKPLGRLALLS